MPLTLKTTKAFEEDLKRAKKREKKLDKLWPVVETLLADDPLDPSFHPHKLSGKWKGFWECHTEPDWLLIWHDETHNTIVLVRLGSHSDLFR